MMSTEEKNASRPPVVAHDEAPSQVTDHVFESRGEWWDLCRHCRLAESAHKETRQTLFHYVGDDDEDDD